MRSFSKYVLCLSLIVFLVSGCQSGNPQSGSSLDDTGDSAFSSQTYSLSSSEDEESLPLSGDSAASAASSSGTATSVGTSSGTSVSASPSSEIQSSQSGSSSLSSSLSSPSIRDGLRVYPVPAGTPSEAGLFTVAANGKNVGLISDNNGWAFPVSFGVFDMDNGYDVKISITVSNDFEISKATILPAGLGIKAAVKNNIATFTINKACNDITVVFDDLYIGPVLHLFVNEIDYEAPTESSDNVLYFGPGYYNLKTIMSGKLPLKSNQTLYVAGGAVIDGTVLINRGASNVKIEGSGVLMKSDQASTGTGTENICLSFNNNSNVTVKNVVVHSHRNPNWTIHIYCSKDVVLDHVKVISVRFASTDSVDITNSQNITITNCFLRACDDTITLKGLLSGAPAACAPLENIHVSNTVLWSDANNAMVLGEESRAKYYKNISFRNIDVLFSYDDKNHHTQLDERSVITICCLDGTYFSDVVWEDIRVNRCERLICFTFKDSYYFNTLKGDQSSPGGIDNILIKDVTVNTTSGSSIANEILLNGWSSDKRITNITFDDVLVMGEKITAKYSGLKTNQYVGTLVFK